MDFIELPAAHTDLLDPDFGPEAAPGRKPRRHEEATPWLFGPAQVAKKAANQLAADASLFDGLF